MLYVLESSSLENVESTGGVQVVVSDLKVEGDGKDGIE